MEFEVFSWTHFIQLVYNFNFIESVDAQPQSAALGRL